MKKDINVNKVVTRLLNSYEQQHKIMTFHMKKINEEYFLVDVDDWLLQEGHVLANNVLQKNLNELCVNQKTARTLHKLFERTWNNQHSSLYKIYLNNQLHVVFLKLIKNDDEGDFIKGFCIPLDQSADLSFTIDIPVFQRTDFIS
ncbi:hypothetical protein P4K49_28090 [Bacillus cereus]|uniref:hypothetical protein n=1 Tax=Bacillus thuringiensis TaxID=1428 RepID=UPI000676DEAF|nr:hypothetical protein [Bacillus thuringiensis]MEB8874830.1 hypothetical protein [Bacillus cereus]AKR38902.1 Hypothetical protein NF53_p5148 [Bacillus thuringiensis serovar indiana]MBG9643156.1 hypothetical protein [Bacillus thuringiensis]MBG9649249.1 hypothetical protein [Bacillus thuringiensis]MEB9620192.1 hypothetical protein [Bacillus cereus]